MEEAKEDLNQRIAKRVRELREGVTLEQVQKVTEPKLIVEGEIRRMEF